MALEYKDYYQILGVSKQASDDDIRKAFRRLARQFHPDVAKNKAQAEDKFKEINEAYEVLGDAEKRRRYDSLGRGWSGSGASGPSGNSFGGRSAASGGGPRGFEFGGTGFSDFFEQFFGSMGNDRGGYRSTGFQQEPERGLDMEADIMVTLEEIMRGSVRSVTLRRGVACSECSGRGAIRGRTCPSCGGTGSVTKEETYNVKIPPGVREGQKLRLAGQGEAPRGKGSAGDLFLRVRFASHPDFRVENGVLCVDLDLAPWEAAVGAKVHIPTLESPLSIRIPAGTQEGQRLRVKQRGLPDSQGSKGDLHIVAHIKIPPVLNEKERALWEQLGKESRFRPREGL